MSEGARGKRHYQPSMWPHYSERAIELLRAAFRQFDYNHFTASQLFALDPKHTYSESRMFVEMRMLVDDTHEGRVGYRVTSRVGRAVADEKKGNGRRKRKDI